MVLFFFLNSLYTDNKVIRIIPNNATAVDR